MAEAANVYTIGHGLMPFAEVARLLETAGVGMVVDVRSTPRSRRNPEFSRPGLDASCRQAELGYRWLGDRLGGRPSDEALWRNGRPDWSAIASGEGFAAGITELEGLITAGPAALLCAESSPEHCHRRGLIAPELELRGYHVVHILPDGSLVPNQPDLFG